MLLTLRTTKIILMKLHSNMDNLDLSRTLWARWSETKMVVYHKHLVTYFGERKVNSAGLIIINNN